MLIAPSILAADMANLKSEVDMLNASAAEWVHFDIMDGVFVPNLSFGFPILEAVRRCTCKPLDVHLMMVQPDRYVERFKESGASILTVQYEACTHLHRVLERIKKLDMKAGVAINPHTPVAVLEEVATLADLVLVMSVDPGFGGQAFIESSYDKISRASELLLRKNSSALVEVDGGVTLNNAPKIKAAGAGALVAGSLVFTAPHPLEAIALLAKI
ncbi:MAG: ribulose-phosphate 3-epimerase [Prevotellaceae bacterium]|jgi:ribulose-phosphate 3-epimerase|nr:ribulose-phosphate 3-epimerase [Prevotellaceae bacterium]